MQWDLTRLYQGFSDPAFTTDFDLALQLTDALVQMFASPKADACEQLCDLVNAFNQLDAVFSKLHSLIMLTLSADSQNEEALAKEGFALRQQEGRSTANWILLDFGDVIIHLFDAQNRLFYDLERIWKDGTQIDPDAL